MTPQKYSKFHSVILTSHLINRLTYVYRRFTIENFHLPILTFSFSMLANEISVELSEYHYYPDTK